MSRGKPKKLIYKIIRLRDEILKIAERNGVENIRVFGSVSRKQEMFSSDIDFLVDITKKPDGTRGNYMAFAIEVGNNLFSSRAVDVCTPENLHPRFRDKVLANCVSIMIDNPDDIDDTEIDERDLLVNVEKAQKAIKYFWEIISLGKEKFLTDRNTQNDASREMQKAVEELVRNITREVKKEIKDVHWGNLRKFRNFIVHNYDNVEWETMWEFSQEKIKEAEYACKRILEVLAETEKKQ